YFAIRYSLSSLFCFFIARQHVISPLPRRQKIKVPELLGQLHRLIDHPLLLVVVTDFDIAGQREVLAQRITIEAIIREDATEIGVSSEEDAVQVVGLALEP